LKEERRKLLFSKDPQEIAMQNKLLFFFTFLAFKSIVFLKSD
jgi:hypothetical protein